jgi:hypothetical protein
LKGRSMRSAGIPIPVSRTANESSRAPPGDFPRPERHEHLARAREL